MPIVLAVTSTVVKGELNLSVLQESVSENGGSQE